MSAFPQPGYPVRGSKSGVPVMALFDLLGRSWSMGILWVLCEGGPGTFRELQARCEQISPTVLNSRIKELCRAGLIGHASNGYHATAMGEELFALLTPLGRWAKSWAQHMRHTQTQDEQYG